MLPELYQAARSAELGDWEEGGGSLHCEHVAATDPGEVRKAGRPSPHPDGRGVAEETLTEHRAHLHLRAGQQLDPALANDYQVLLIY